MEQTVHTIQSFACFCKKNHPADRSVQPVDNPYKSTIWLLVFMGKIGVDHIFQRLITGTIYLYNIASSFAYRDVVIVFIDNILILYFHLIVNSLFVSSD